MTARAALAQGSRKKRTPDSDPMKTLTQGETRLPRPPIAADDVPIDNLPTRSLRRPTCNAFRSVEMTASKLARKQDDSKDGDGVLFSTLESAEAHVVGKVGEIVTSEVLDFPLDKNIYSEGDPGYDHQLQGTTLDTKTTRTDCSEPQLIVSAEDAPPADYFVLVHIVDGETARVVGFTDRKTVVEREARRWPGTHSNYVVGWDELYPPRWFKTLVMGRLVTGMREAEYVHERGCQLCGSHLTDDTEYLLSVDEEELQTTLALCDSCHCLLSAARDGGRVAEFQIYERP